MSHVDAQPGATIRVLVTGPDVRTPGGAGVQRHVRSLVEVFESGESCVITPFSATTVQSDEHVLRKVLRTLGKWSRFPFALRGQDVVHVNASIDTKSLLRDLGFVAIAAFMRRPLVLQFHGGSIARIAWSRGPVARRVVSRVLASPRVILFLSEEQRAPMLDAFRLRRTRLIRNYVDVGSATPSYDVTPGVTRVLYIGRLVESKGIRILLTAVREFDPQRWDVAIGGSGALETEVREEASRSGSCVRFEGFVEGGEKDRLLREADILVLPSSHDEGLPYVLLEAAAHGCALVATDRGASAQVCRQGQNGTIIPENDAESLRDALRAMADTPERLDAMKRASRAIIEEDFSFETMHRVFADLYAQAMRGGSNDV